MERLIMKYSYVLAIYSLSLLTMTGGYYWLAIFCLIVSMVSNAVDYAIQHHEKESKKQQD